MYRIKEIQDKLLNVVGWEQSYNPAEAIAERLTETESGLYFQGAHPLVTLDNMAAIVPDNWGFQYPVWNDTKEWKAETVVQYANDAAGKPLYWVALVDNVAEVPAEGSTFWEKYNILSFTFPAMRQYCCLSMLVAFRRQIQPFRLLTLVVPMSP